MIGLNNKSKVNDMELTSHTNHLGFKQYRNANGVDICPECLVPYTNTGEGVLCDACGEEELLVNFEPAV